MERDSYSSFNRNFENIGYDYGWSVAYSQYDENIILTGSRESTIQGDKDLWAIKTNNRGLTIFDKKFGGNRNEEGLDVISTRDGGYVFVGYTWSFGNEQQILLNQNGFDW